MDLTDLIGRAIETEYSEVVGQVVGFKYYNGRLVLTVVLDEEEDFGEDDDDPDPAEEAPQEEERKVIHLIASGE